jgi:hypothetical protein
VVVAVINYYSEIDLITAIQTAKCCLAKKQSAQVIREANLMGRSSELECDTNFLISAIYLLENYVWGGEYNQITENEENELIQRVNTMCECSEPIPYEVIPAGSCSNFSPICVSGSYAQEGGDPVNLTPQTVVPDIVCNYVFIIYAIENYTVVLRKNGSVWQIVDDENVELATNPTLNGKYDFAISDFNYTIVVSIGACT